jgi:hypothetical protein
MAKTETVGSKEIVLAPMGGRLLMGGKIFKTAKWVTRSVLQQKPEEAFYVQFEGPIHLSPMDPDNSKFKDADGVGNVPDIANVINLSTGEFQVLIINVVLGSELRQSYPNDAYVGKMFGIMQTKSAIDKRFKTYKIIELELDDNAPGGAEAVKHIDGESPEAIERAKGRNKAA